MESHIVSSNFRLFYLTTGGYKVHYRNRYCKFCGNCYHNVQGVQVYPGYGVPQYSYVATAATTVVSATAAIFNSITITETAADTVIVYDHASGAGTIVASFKASVAEGTYTFNVACTTGITVISAANTKFTVAYTPIA